MMRVVFLCLLSFSLSACAKTPINLDYYNIGQIETVQDFYVCHSYGCRATTSVQLSEKEWDLITLPLQARLSSAVEEREQIAESIALMEKITGEKTGTYRDVEGATMRGHGYYQLDCIDEAINTSKYLRFFAEDSLFDFHDVLSPARRGTFIDGAWPHNTAVITERKNGERYAIDSWFFDNGQAPAIVPLDIWLKGWKPKES